jgi:hypothetical protein
MVLELNARPGLAIQVANGEGLWPRVKLIDKEAPGGTERRPNGPPSPCKRFQASDAKSSSS